MQYEPVIGLEVHAQLKTKTKIFCGCPTDFGADPNKQVCPVCIGMPGVLPVLNKTVVDCAIKSGLALNCTIAEFTKFDRKNYFYPDLPKGYQISQFNKPICSNGYLIINGKKIRILRAHLEEDAGKLVHAGAAGLHGSDYSLVDYNRGGVPLLEIVSEPDIETPEEARLYLTELRTILRYIDVCDGNLEEGSFRCDANVSVRPVGETKLGTKTEIKNMNSFKAVQRAIQSEIERQIQALNKGERIVQETRLWNEASQSTHVMRSKEEAHDYRYFPEPDLVPLKIESKWVQNIQATLPELPELRRKRYVETLGLSVDDAYILAENKELGDFYDQVLALNNAVAKTGASASSTATASMANASGALARSAANLLLGPTIAYLKEAKLDLLETKITPQNLKDIVENQTSGVLSSTTAKQVLLEVLQKTGSVNDVIKQKGLAQVSDEGELVKIVETVLNNNPTQLEQYKQGQNKLRQYFFGEIMKATKGKANPQIINKLLDEKLSQ
jgi:aspartyl-tRNA(Asn)/glutamyl-tRNA(Gln) amidotransferase subunit B